MYILGVDIGGSTAKMILADGEGKYTGRKRMEKGDFHAAPAEQLDIFLKEQGVSYSEISFAGITGVGTERVYDKITALPLSRIDEFTAIGRGGLSLTGLEEGIVISMGTGTSFVKAGPDGCFHMGGTGVGGGMLVGLGNPLSGTHNIHELIALAAAGDLSKVDLNVGELTHQKLNNLTADITAANFGFVKPEAAPADYALGLINTVFQTVGTMAAFLDGVPHKTPIVIIGTTASSVTMAPQLLGMVEGLHDMKFIIPKHASFATALGAALEAAKK